LTLILATRSSRCQAPGRLRWEWRSTPPARAFITDPTLRNTDGDPADDGVEIANGTDPTDASDFPSDLGNFIESVVPTNGEEEGVGGSHSNGTFFAEDVLVFNDRIHEWNGLTEEGIPEAFIGGDYVRNANDSRGNADFSEEVTLKAPASLYLLWDDREDLEPWTTDGLGLDFEDTGLDVGYDETTNAANREGLEVGPGMSIDNTASVYIARDTNNGNATTLEVGTPYTFFPRSRWRQLLWYSGDRTDGHSDGGDRFGCGFGGIQWRRL
jgi:hypothetical protein